LVEAQVDRVAEKAFVERIVEWYRRSGDRRLPWRTRRDPWSVLLAAFLLRKTTVGQVARVYGKILRELPSPAHVLRADTQRIERLLRPLGMHRQRARLLRKLAQRIVESHGGRVPGSKAELMALPGIGQYAASEVLLAAHGQREPLLDRNMARVLGRVFGVKLGKRPHTDPELWVLARSILPRDAEDARSFCWGVLDFARQICTARSPKCPACFVRDICSSARTQVCGGAAGR
jgi:A/G-specific adenine glycosylase